MGTMSLRTSCSARAGGVLVLQRFDDFLGVVSSLELMRRPGIADVVGLLGDMGEMGNMGDGIWIWKVCVLESRLLQYQRL